MKKLLVLMLAGFLLAGCHFADYVTPKTGPGTDFPCGVDGEQCSDGTCCGYKLHCAGTDRCDGVAYDGNKDWIGVSRPRTKAPK